MISAQELIDPTTPVLRVIEVRALHAQQNGQQFICLTSIDGYLPVKEQCDKVLREHGYEIFVGTLGWGDYIPKMIAWGKAI
jgi:peptidoglycan/xylan/chitin deacetylase (PgdA/CDA1 family)